MSNTPTIAKWKCVHEYDDGSLGEIMVEPNDSVEKSVNIVDGDDLVYIHSKAQFQQLIKALEAASLQQWPEETGT